MRIGIGDSESGQDGGFQSLHLFGIALIFVVMTQQVQHAVNGKVQHMIAQELLRRFGFPGGDAMGNRDITEIALAILLRRERQNVGRLVLAAKGCVKIAQLLIVRQQQRQGNFSRRNTRGQQGRIDRTNKARLQAASGSPPWGRFDDDR